MSNQGVDKHQGVAEKTATPFLCIEIISRYDI